MKTKKTKIALYLSYLLMGLSLLGCGDDGDAGSIGKPGGLPASSVTQLNLDVTQVQYQEGHAIVTVFASNENDLPVVGLQKLKMQKIAQLIPQGVTGAGNASQWQVLAQYHAEFEDQKDGHYVFTVPLSDYNPQLTQRYNLIASASTLADGITTVPYTEYVEDLAADGSAPLMTRNIVDSNTCFACHAEGKTFVNEPWHSTTTEGSCATCHSSELDTDKQWHYLIHNLHNSSQSFTTELKTYDGITAENIVQNNCTTCHETETTAELSEAMNWATMPTMETCSSCHSNIDFKEGQGHPTQADNSNCIACHSSEWTQEVHTAQSIAKQSITDAYTMQPAMTVDAVTKIATLKIGLLDKEGQVVELTPELIKQIQQIEATFNIGPNHTQVNWEAMHFNLVRDGVLANTSDVHSRARLTDSVVIENNQFVLTTMPLTLEAVTRAETPHLTGSLTAIEGDQIESNTLMALLGMGLCHDGEKLADCSLENDGSNNGDSFIGTRSKLVYAATIGEPATRHIDSIDAVKCQSCHKDDLHNSSHHSGYKFDWANVDGTPVADEDKIGIAGCVTCHGSDGTPYSAYGALERKLHHAHSVFDGLIGNNCTACHSNFNLDSFSKKSSIATVSDNPYNDADGPVAYSTPITATCTSCHEIGLDGMHNQAFLEGQGGAIVDGITRSDVDAAAGNESCFTCHAPTIADHTQINL